MAGVSLGIQADPGDGVLGTLLVVALVELHEAGCRVRDTPSAGSFEALAQAQGQRGHDILNTTWPCMLSSTLMAYISSHHIPLHNGIIL